MKKLVIAGGSGYLGNQLAYHYKQVGTNVVILTRAPKKGVIPGVKYVEWDGEYLDIWVDELEEADVLINLAGKSVNCRYNARNRQLICDSRVNPTRVLGEAVQVCEMPPKVWINASSATIYRHAEDRPMDEERGEIGSGFSVEVVKKWEKAFGKLKLPSTRKVILRTGIVIGAGGGAFLPLMRLARLGFGGKLGNGHQYFSWLHEHDFVRIIDFLIRNEELKGLHNACAPVPVTNEHLMQVLRKSFHMPLELPLNKLLLELGAFIIGTETELVLKSRWVVPSRLLRAGFKFNYPDIESAVENIVRSLETPSKVAESTE